MQSDVKIKENADWYYANQDDLVSKYKGKYVAISDCGVVGSFDTFGSGVHAMIDSGRLPGTFIVHHCLPPEEERQMYYFHSNRVDFGKVNA